MTKLTFFAIGTGNLPQECTIVVEDFSLEIKDVDEKLQLNAAGAEMLANWIFDYLPANVSKQVSKLLDARAAELRLS